MSHTLTLPDTVRSSLTASVDRPAAAVVTGGTSCAPDNFALLPNHSCSVGLAHAATIIVPAAISERCDSCLRLLISKSLALRLQEWRLGSELNRRTRL